MAKNTTTRWDALSMRDRASLIKLYSQSGIKKLDDMRAHYNKFDTGGDKEPWYQTLLSSMSSARDAKIGAIGAQQIRDLYAQGENELAEELAKQYTVANGIGIAGGVASGVGAGSLGTGLAKGIGWFGNTAMPSSLLKGAAYYLPGVAAEAAAISPYLDAAALAAWTGIGYNGAKNRWDSGDKAGAIAEGAIASLPLFAVAPTAINKAKNATSGFFKVMPDNMVSSGAPAEKGFVISESKFGHPTEHVVAYDSESLLKPYMIEDLGGGYMLKSLMRGNPLEKQISKQGTVNVHNIKALIGKGSKIERAVVDKVLASEEFAGKKSVDYNKFRKAIQDELITYDRTPDTRWENYGGETLNWGGSNNDIKEWALSTGDYIIAPWDKNKPNWEIVSLIDKRTGEEKFIQRDLEPLYKKEHGVTLNTYTFSSPRIPQGSGKHYNQNTLGHSRTYTMADEPDVLHVMESQSDWAQGRDGAYRRMRDRYNENAVNQITEREEIISHHNKKIEELENLISKDNKILESGISESGYPLDDLDKTYYRKEIKKAEEDIAFYKNEAENEAEYITRAKNAGYEALTEDYLTDNYITRQIQENLRYAAERGQTKMRYPTRETAAKIEGYQAKEMYVDEHGLQHDTPYEYDPEIKSKLDATQKRFDEISRSTNESDMPEYERLAKELSELSDAYTNSAVPIKNAKKVISYASEHEGILRKYDAFPKQYQKLFKGADVRTVTDPKGNTWYEVDVPEDYLHQEWQYAKGGPLLRRFDAGGDTDDEYYDFLPASVVTAKLPSINTAAGKRVAKNISERVASGKTSLSEVPDRYKSYVEGEVKGAMPVRNAINTTGVKTALGTLAVPAGVIAGAELSAASPYVWRGIDFLGNVDGLRNLFTDNGIKKTIQKYNEGDTWGTIKSGAGDLLDIIGIGDSVRMAAKLANKGYRAYHAYNTIEPYSYGNASRRFKNWAKSMFFEKKYNTPIWADGLEESKYIDLVKQDTQKLNEVFDPQRRIAGIDTGKDISSKAADFTKKARRDAWSLYLGRKPKYGMYTKNQDGSFSYSADRLAEYYGDNPRFGDLLKATKEGKHDHIGNTHGGLWRADNSELGHVGGDSLLTRTDFGNLRIEDLWDLQPFSRQGDGPFARINELWTDKFGSQTLRNKAQSFREWMYDNGHWGEYGKKNDLLGTILRPLDRPLNIYRSGWKSKLVKDTDNLDSFIIDFKDAPAGYHWADVPIAKTADKIIDAITDNKLTRFIDNKVRNIEVGPILGGKPFMMKTDIPYTSKIMFNQTKGLDPLENTMGVETVFGKIIPEGYLDPTLYKSAELKNFLNETKNFNFNNITTKDLLTPLAYGGSIHIKPENRGKFNALLKRTGKSASWFKEHGTPLQRKRATFALNARKWKHPDGGEINVLGNPSYNKAQEEYMYRYLKDSGMDDTHVAAIMGNIAVESGLNADKKQIKGPAWGLIQAEGSRQEAIKNYNDVPYLFGSKLSPEEQRQLDYIIEKGIRTYTPGEWGMEGFKGARQARKGFINETDLTKATDIFMRNYERPSKQHRSWRQNMSKYYYDKYKEPEYYVPLDFFNK